MSGGYREEMVSTAEGRLGLGARMHLVPEAETKSTNC